MVYLYKRILSFFICILYLSSYASQEELFASSFDENKKELVVTIPPLLLYVNWLLPNYFKLNSVLNESDSLHHYEIKPSDMVKLNNNSLFICLNKNFIWDKKCLSYLNDKADIIEAGSNVPFLYTHTKTCSHSLKSGKEHKHCHSDRFIDSHIWFSIVNAKLILTTIKKAFLKLYPQEKETINRNYGFYLAYLDDLHKQLADTFIDKKIKSLFITHPSWAYFAKDYHLEQFILEKHGQQPSTKHFCLYLDNLKKEKNKFILVTPETPISITRKLSKENNVKIIQINPLSYYWDKEMKKIISMFNSN